MLDFDERDQKEKKSELKQEQGAISKHRSLSCHGQVPITVQIRETELGGTVQGVEITPEIPSCFESGFARGASEIPPQLHLRPPLRIKCNYSLQ